MKLSLFGATFAILLWGTAPAFADLHCTGGDVDNDTFLDNCDNCSSVYNPDQTDTDQDQCGNLCDADYTQDGFIGMPDFFDFGMCFQSAAASCADQDHTEPDVVPAGAVIGFADFFVFARIFGGPPGPSGTTLGTTACP